MREKKDQLIHHWQVLKKLYVGHKSSREATIQIHLEAQRAETETIHRSSQTGWDCLTLQKFDLLCVCLTLLCLSHI